MHEQSYLDRAKLNPARTFKTPMDVIVGQRCAVLVLTHKECDTPKSVAIERAWMSGSARNSSVGGFPLHDTSPAPIQERLQASEGRGGGGAAGGSITALEVENLCRQVSRTSTRQVLPFA